MGQHVMDGFIQGVIEFGKNIWERVKSAFEDFGTKIKKFFWYSFTFKGFCKLWGFLVQGMENGFNKEGKNLYKNVSGTLNDFTEKVQDNLNNDNVLNVGVNTDSYNSVLNGLKKFKYGIKCKFTIDSKPDNCYK